MRYDVVARIVRTLILGAGIVHTLVACSPSVSIGPAATATPAPATATPAPTITTAPPSETEVTAAPTEAPAATTTTPVQQTIQCTITARSLRVRSGPGTNFAQVGGLPFNQAITATGRNADSSWLAIQNADGTQGWVAADFVNCATPPSSLPETPAP